MQISYFVSFMILIPVALLWSVTGPVLNYLGSEEEISNHSWKYALILMCALPGRIIYRNLTAYFGAMKILKPSVRSSVIGISVNLLVGLPIVLGWPFNKKEGGFQGFGFYACPVVTSCVEYCMMLYMIYCFKTIKTENDCWPDNGWSWANIDKEMVKKYFALYIPSALAISSAFWRVAAIGAVCASLGPLQLGVFNMSYRVLWITLTFVGSVAGASGIKTS